MEDWNYSFEPVPKSAWIRQIESDLKGKPIESLFSTLWDGEYLNAIAHSEDIGGERLCLPSYLFQQPPILAERFSLLQSETSSLNKQLLQSLSYGTQALHIETSLEYFEHLNASLSGVLTDIVEVNIECPLNALESWLHQPNFHQLNIGLRLPMGSPRVTNDQFENITRLAAEFPDHTSFVYGISATGNWIQQTTSLFQQIIHDLKALGRNGISAEYFLSKCVLQLEADALFFKQLIQTRSLHFLFQNLVLHITGKEVPSGVKYLDTSVCQSDEEHNDHFLIRASMSGLAASLSGIHRLNFQPLSTSKDPELYRRVSRNIHHLLSLESGMYKGEDPLAGAYSLDNHVRHWVEKIWSQLNV
jgi:hypothetical protein